MVNFYQNSAKLQDILLHFKNEKEIHLKRINNPSVLDIKNISGADNSAQFKKQINSQTNTFQKLSFEDSC